MLFKPSKYLTLVVYEDSKSTKCFQFPKTQLKIVLTLIPLVIFFSLGLSVMALTLRMGPPKIRAPRFSNDSPKYKEQVEKMELQMEELSGVNKELVAKVNQGGTKLPEESLNFWPSLLRPGAGFKDLTQNSPIKLENFTPKMLSGGGVQLAFNIAHTLTGEIKTSGHILVMMKAGNSLQFYPKTNENFDQGLTSFNLGETFTVHRFRPVEANFPDPITKGSTLWFKVLIFNRSGDLLQKQNLGPYNL